MNGKIIVGMFNMFFNDFSYEEKKALLRSACIIADADGKINYSENQYLSRLILLMNADRSIINEIGNMSNNTMESVISNMSSSKKEVVLDTWLKTMARAKGGQAFGNIRLSSYPTEGNIIRILAVKCNISLKGDSFMISQF